MNETLRALHELKMNTVLIWPNMDAGSDGISKAIRVFREQENPQYMHFFKSLPIEYYAPLLKNAACIVGNSSSGIREAAFLGTPAVNIGTRQNGRERGCNVLDVAYDRGEILHAVEKQMGHGPYPPDYIYGDGTACKKIVDILGKVQFRIQKRIRY